MATLVVNAGKDTESLLQMITNELDDASLDTIDVRRDVEKSQNLATEPLTLAATLVFSAPLMVAIGRIMERWLENKNQLQHLHIIAEGFSQSDAAGKALAEVSKAHARVSVEYKLPTAPTKQR